MDTQECNVLDQSDPEMKNLNLLTMVSKKLRELSQAFDRCQDLTDKLGQILSVVIKDLETR